MLPKSVLDRFVERCPAVVMVRATLENLLRPERLDRIFEESAERQYSKVLLFSRVVAVMSAVATRTHRSVHAAYLAFRRELGVSPAALYEKLNHLEPNVSSALIRQTAADAAKVMDAMPAGRRHVLPGREIYYLDGNHLAGSEHRQKVELTDGPHRWRLRRITVQLDRPTANGDPEIHLLSDLPARSVSPSGSCPPTAGVGRSKGPFKR